MATELPFPICKEPIARVPPLLIVIDVQPLRVKTAVFVVVRSDVATSIPLTPATVQVFPVSVTEPIFGRLQVANAGDGRKNAKINSRSGVKNHGFLNI